MHNCRPVAGTLILTKEEQSNGAGAGDHHTNGQKLGHDMLYSYIDLRDPNIRKLWRKSTTIHPKYKGAGLPFTITNQHRKKSTGIIRKVNATRTINFGDDLLFGLQLCTSIHQHGKVQRSTHHGGSASERHDWNRATRNVRPLTSSITPIGTTWKCIVASTCARIVQVRTVLMIRIITLHNFPAIKTKRNGRIATMALLSRRYHIRWVRTAPAHAVLHHVRFPSLGYSWEEFFKARDHWQNW